MLAQALPRQRERLKMADPTSFEYQIEDDQGLTNRSQLFVAYDASTETVSALQGAWSAYGGLLDAMIDGQIVGGQMLIPLIADPSWKDAPAAGNNVNQVMSLNFNNDFNSYATSILVPSYKETQVNSTSPKAPNLAATALAAFIAAVLAGEGGEVFPNSRDLHDLNALRDAFLTVRKVRNQRQRTKVTP
jgi:hypothetical protein